VMLAVRSLARGLPLSPAIDAKLQAYITKMSDAVARGDSEQYIDGALSFHRSLVEMGGNGTFLKLWDSLHWEVRGRIALRRLAAIGAGLSPMVAMHVRLIQALREGAGQRAVEVLTTILQTVADAFNLPTTQSA
jgi:DNA-binding GntR family transcriptional regulator